MAQRRTRTGVGRALLWVLGGYLVLRAALEPFVVDVADPATYRDDWGGPSLLGVLAVHMGPGLVALALGARWVSRRRSPARARGR